MTYDSLASAALVPIAVTIAAAPVAATPQPPSVAPAESAAGNSPGEALRERLELQPLDAAAILRRSAARPLARNEAGNEAVLLAQAATEEDIETEDAAAVAEDAPPTAASPPPWVWVLFPLAGGAALWGAANRRRADRVPPEARRIGDGTEPETPLRDRLGAAIAGDRALRERSAAAEPDEAARSAIALADGEREAIADPWATEPAGATEAAAIASEGAAVEGKRPESAKAAPVDFEVSASRTREAQGFEARSRGVSLGESRDREVPAPETSERFQTSTSDSRFVDPATSSNSVNSNPVTSGFETSASQTSELEISQAQTSEPEISKTQPSEPGNSESGVSASGTAEPTVSAPEPSESGVADSETVAETFSETFEDPDEVQGSDAATGAEPLVSEAPVLMPPERATLAGEAALATGPEAVAWGTTSGDRAQFDVEASRYDVGQGSGAAIETGVSLPDGLADVDAGLPDLPAGYGDSRIVLMPRDPEWAYAYWDVPAEHREARRKEGGTRLALRLFDVTDIVRDRQQPHSVQQYDCNELAREWHLPVPVADRDYLLEIGYLTDDGRWLMLARSNAIRVPPVYPSDWFSEQFVTVNWDDDLRGRAIAELDPPQRRAVPLTPLYQRMADLAQAAEAQRQAGSLLSSGQSGAVAGSRQSVSSFALGSGIGFGGDRFQSGVGMSGVGMSGVGMSGIGMSGLGVGARMSGVGMSGIGMSGVGFGPWMSGIGMSGVGMGVRMSGVGMSGVGMSGVGMGARMSGVGMSGIGMSGIGMSGVGFAPWMSGVGMSGVGMGARMSGVGMSGIGMSGVGMGARMSGVGMSGVGMSGIGMSGIGMSGVGFGAWASGIGMSGIGFAASMPPVRPRKFWLVANAELIVYGATEPDAAVTVGGIPVELQPDGTFRFHVAFPDGNIDYPIFAVAADGEQARSVHLTFDRETPENRTNTREEATEEWFDGPPPA